MNNEDSTPVDPTVSTSQNLLYTKQGRHMYLKVALITVPIMVGIVILYVVLLSNPALRVALGLPAAEAQAKSILNVIFFMLLAVVVIVSNIWNGIRGITKRKAYLSGKTAVEVTGPAAFWEGIYNFIIASVVLVGLLIAIALIFFFK